MAAAEVLVIIHVRVHVGDIVVAIHMGDVGMRVLMRNVAMAITMRRVDVRFVGMAIVVGDVVVGRVQVGAVAMGRVRMRVVAVSDVAVRVAMGRVGVRVVAVRVAMRDVRMAHDQTETQSCRETQFREPRNLEIPILSRIAWRHRPFETNFAAFLRPANGVDVVSRTQRRRKRRHKIFKPNAIGNVSGGEETRAVGR